MKRSRLSLLLVLLAACTSGGERPSNTSNWGPVALDHARCFTVERRGSERRLTVFGPGGTMDTVGVYHLSMNGTTGHLPLPLSRIAVVSTTHLSYLHALGGLDIVVGAAHLDRLVDPDLMTLVKDVVPDIGTANGLDRELLVALAPQALLDYPFGQGDATNTLPSVPRIAVTEYLEEHPLGRAEWLRFFGVLLGRERTADSLYKAITARYAAALHSEGNAHPRVFFGSSWQGRWYVPPGNSYMAQLIADAGGEYCFSSIKAGENVAMDLEQVLDETARSDHFGAVLANSASTDPTVLAGGDRRIAGMKAVSQGGFVGNSARSDFFGRALLEPDLVLRDLRCIFHPTDCAGHAWRYFAPIAQ